jgi:hypothetical protein
MAYERIKSEHAGAKNGGGSWMTRAEAKRTAKRELRRLDEIEAALSTEDSEDSWQVGTPERQFGRSGGSGRAAPEPRVPSEHDREGKAAARRARPR